MIHYCGCRSEALCHFFGGPYLVRYRSPVCRSVGAFDGHLGPDVVMFSFV